ncbi:hypothetical protein [Aeromicrobium sp. CTD01-1L150]|uniref:hypothetical protein n=1 Tax=Aeromicrobium sp. CTD01-1L150 TaxID=3341830 RepID=UPI0035C21FE0
MNDRQRVHESNIVDRYVHATLRTVPKGRRREIGAELRALIDDMVESRTQDGEPAGVAEHAVLTELGNPTAWRASTAG